MESHSLMPSKKSSQRQTSAKDEKVIANDFNNFFCSVGQNTVAKIHTITDKFNCDQNRVPFVPRTIPQSDQFIINMVLQEEVKQIIIKMPLGKAPGLDKIPLRVIKYCLSAILTPLTSIINASFTSQVYHCNVTDFVFISLILKSPLSGDDQ